MIYPEALLIIPRLRVQNANAISSHLTWGFPAPSAFTGFMHALERQTKAQLNLSFDGVGIISHKFEPQVTMPNGRRNYVFRQTRNPLTKEGSVAGIVEEGRAHLEVTLVFGVSGEGVLLPEKKITEVVGEQIEQMRLAGGSILPRLGRGSSAPTFKEWPGTEDAQRALNKQVLRRLLPGFALISRQDLLVEQLNALKKHNPAATEIDALLDSCRLNFEPPAGEKGEWSIRTRRGWIVPLAVGYAGISELFPPGAVKNARDPSVPFRFVESVLTLGEWISPHRVHDVRALLWKHDYDASRATYLCTNDFALSATA